MKEFSTGRALVSCNVPGIKKMASSLRAHIVYKEELVRGVMIQWKKHLGSWCSSATSVCSWS